MKSLEQQLLEKENELRDLRKAVGKAGLVQQLSESGLPAPAQARLRKRFEAAGNIDGLKTAITEEKEYLRKVNASPRRVEQQQDTSQRSLVECYQAFGLTEKEAKIAAGVEGAIGEIKESEQRLYDAAKAMGLSDAEAKAFSGPKQSLSW